MVAAVKILLEKRGLLLGCLGALSFLLYANCALNGFVFDDHSPD